MRAKPAFWGRRAETMKIGFELIPAIDLKGGKCVRLRQGDAERSTEYSDDPLAMALHWEAQGASRLHLVDLDGAFSGKSIHLDLAASIFSRLAIPVQFGGGLRTMAQVERILELGAERAILGSVAVEHPEIAEEAARRFPGSVVVGIDARNGMVALHGWVDESRVLAVDLARRMKEAGIERVIYTDIARDGVLNGVNLAETERLALQAQVRVLASGGISTLEDVRALWDRRDCGIEGAILGRALYDKKLSFPEVIARLSEW
jgi:phosphoribosylformimino-5-aminoimidazole carboxamide ribotide isomerase